MGAEIELGVIFPNLAAAKFLNPQISPVRQPINDISHFVIVRVHVVITLFVGGKDTSGVTTEQSGVSHTCYLGGGHGYSWFVLLFIKQHTDKDHRTRNNHRQQLNDDDSSGDDGKGYQTPSRFALQLDQRTLSL